MVEKKGWALMSAEPIRSAGSRVRSCVEETQHAKERYGQRRRTLSSRSRPSAE